VRAAVGCAVSRADGEGEDSRVRRFVIATGDVARDNHTIDANGWKLENFSKGGSVLWAHNLWQDLPPIAKPVRTWLEGDKLMSDAQFTTREEHALGDTVLRLYDGGYLRGASVRWRPVRWSINEARGGVDFHEQELLEWSATPVPADPGALIQARSADIDIAPLIEIFERALSGGELHDVRREDLEQLVRSVRPPQIQTPREAERGSEPKPEPVSAPTETAKAPESEPATRDGDQGTETRDCGAGAAVSEDAEPQTKTPPATPARAEQTSDDDDDIDIDPTVLRDVVRSTVLAELNKITGRASGT